MLLPCDTLAGQHRATASLCKMNALIFRQIPACNQNTNSVDGLYSGQWGCIREVGVGEGQSYMYQQCCLVSSQWCVSVSRSRHGGGCPDRPFITPATSPSLQSHPPLPKPCSLPGIPSPSHSLYRTPRPAVENTRTLLMRDLAPPKDQYIDFQIMGRKRGHVRRPAPT